MEDEDLIALTIASELMDVARHEPANGREIARLLQSRFDVPILYVTAHADQPTRARATAKRPIGFLAKPSSGMRQTAAVAAAFINR